MLLIYKWDCDHKLFICLFKHLYEKFEKGLQTHSLGVLIILFLLIIYNMIDAYLQKLKEKVEKYVCSNYKYY